MINIGDSIVKESNDSIIKHEAELIVVTAKLLL
jgi:hypothetical protein